MATLVQDHAAVARSTYEAFNARNFDHTVNLVTPDFQWVNVPFGVTHNGPEGAREFLTGWATAFPDAQCEINNMFGGENHAVSQGHFRGTHTVALRTPTGEIAPTNRRVDISFSEVYRFNGDRIQHITCYYDAATLLRQLGVIS